MVDYREILKNARAENGFTQSALAKKLGLGLRMYQKIEKGYLPKFKRNHIQNIDQILGTNIYELIYEKKHNKNAVANIEQNNNAFTANFENLMEVCYLPAYVQSAYIHTYAKEKQKADKTLDKILIPKEYEQGLYMVIEVAGDSMDDGTKKSICDSDKLLIKELDRAYWEYNKLNYSDYIFVLFTKHVGIIYTQIIKHSTEKNVFSCQPKNELYKRFNITTKEIYKLFYVKKIIERKIR